MENTAFEEKVETFKVAGHELTLRPLRLKELKRLLKIIESTMKEFQGFGAETPMGEVAEIVVGKNNDFMSFLFPKEKYDFMCPEFIEDNFTMPMVRAIVTSVLEMNGLKDFFAGKVGTMTPPTT